MSRPLLSICIPTYNRSAVLRETLLSFLNDPAFDDDVELVISDNASPDDTPAVVQAIITEYHNKRIIYHRNTENVRDLNFSIVLSLGNGHYLKLLNDYATFSAGGLDYMKKCICSNIDNPNNLFFLEFRKPYKNELNTTLSSVNEMVRFWTDQLIWIISFGVWKKDLQALINRGFDETKQLLQVNWLLCLQEERCSTVVNFPYYVCSTRPLFRSKYNFFVPHVQNFYEILYSYEKKGLLSSDTITYTKKRCLQNVHANSIIEYLIKKEDRSWDLEGGWEIVHRYYGDGFFLYWNLFTYHIKNTLVKLRNRIKQ